MSELRNEESTRVSQESGRPQGMRISVPKGNSPFKGIDAE